MNEFHFFSVAHYAALAAAVIVLGILIGFRNYWRLPRMNRALKLALAAILLLCELLLQLSYIWAGSWSVHSLPLQLCSLTLIISAAVLLWNTKRFNSIVYFLGLLGAVQALVTPNLAYSFPHFRYFHFFVAHIAIIAAAVVVSVIDGYRPSLRSVFAAMLWLHALAIPAFVINLWSGETNYMFLAGKPDTASLLDLLAPWPWYLLQLEGIATLLCLALLGITKGFIFISDKRRK